MAESDQARDVVSTLEVDVTAVAPQVTLSTLLVSYKTNMSIQVAYGAEPEVAISKTPLEISPWYFEKTVAKARKDKTSQALPSVQIRKKIFRRLIVVAVILVIIAVGVGVGASVGIPRSHPVASGVVTSNSDISTSIPRY